MVILNAGFWLAMIQIFRKWLVLIIDINQLGDYPPPFCVYVNYSYKPFSKYFLTHTHAHIYSQLLTVNLSKISCWSHTDEIPLACLSVKSIKALEDVLKSPLCPLYKSGHEYVNCCALKPLQ